MLFQDILTRNQKLSDEKIAAKAREKAEKDAKAAAKAEAEAKHLADWLAQHPEAVTQAMRAEIAEFLKLNELRPTEVSIVEVPEWDLYNRWCRFGGFEIQVEYLDLDMTSYVWNNNADLHEFYFCHTRTISVKEFVRVGEDYCVVFTELPKSRASCLETWDHRNEH